MAATQKERPSNSLGHDPLEVISGPPMPQAVIFLQIYALVLMIIPSDNVIKAIGGSAHLAGLIGLAGFAWWIASMVFKVHDPRQYPSPIRLTLLVVWICALASYAVMHLHERPAIEMNGADRWLLQLVSWTGVVMVAIEGCNSVEDFRKVLRALSIGGAVCGVVAAVQFWLRVDLSTYLRMIPGFTQNSDTQGILARYSQARVAGTSIHPIELGVVASCLLPISLWTATMYEGRSRLRKWAPSLLIGLCIPMSVSRSAILAVVLSMGLFIGCLAHRRRAIALSIAPLALAAVFMGAPGLIGTLRGFFEMGSSDPSVSYRQNDYPLAERLITGAPWFGQGPGTYLPVRPIDIFDNEYLKMMVEFGLLGAIAVVIAYFIFPVVIAFGARKRSTSPDARLLGAALGSAAAVTLVCSATFDALSFPMFAGLHALIVGLIGAYWRLIRAEERARPATTVVPAHKESDVTSQSRSEASEPVDHISSAPLAIDEEN